MLPTGNNSGYYYSRRSSVLDGRDKDRERREREAAEYKRRRGLAGDYRRRQPSSSSSHSNHHDPSPSSSSGFNGKSHNNNNNNNNASSSHHDMIPTGPRSYNSHSHRSSNPVAHNSYSHNHYNNFDRNTGSSASNSSISPSSSSSMSIPFTGNAPNSNSNSNSNSNFNSNFNSNTNPAQRRDWSSRNNSFSRDNRRGYSEWDHHHKRPSHNNSHNNSNHNTNSVVNGEYAPNRDTYTASPHIDESHIESSSSSLSSSNATHTVKSELVPSRGHRDSHREFRDRNYSMPVSRRDWNSPATSGNTGNYDDRGAYKEKEPSRARSAATTVKEIKPTLIPSNPKTTPKTATSTGTAGTAATATATATATPATTTTKTKTTTKTSGPTTITDSKSKDKISEIKSEVIPPNHVPTITTPTLESSKKVDIKVEEQVQPPPPPVVEITPPMKVEEEEEDLFPHLLGAIVPTTSTATVGKSSLLNARGARSASPNIRKTTSSPAEATMRVVTTRARSTSPTRSVLSAPPTTTREDKTTKSTRNEEVLASDTALPTISKPIDSTTPAATTTITKTDLTDSNIDNPSLKIDKERYGADGEKKRKNQAEDDESVETSSTTTPAPITTEGEDPEALTILAAMEKKRRKLERSQERDRKEARRAERKLAKAKAVQATEAEVESDGKARRAEPDQNATEKKTTENIETVSATVSAPVSAPVSVPVSVTEKTQTEKIDTELKDKEVREIELKEKERVEKERIEKERLEKERLEKERLAKERLEKERLEKEHLETERLEKERLEKERLEKERLEEERLEKERLEKERLEKERLEKENLQAQTIEIERLKDEPLQAETFEKELSQKEQLEKDRFAEFQARLIEKENLKQETLQPKTLKQDSTTPPLTTASSLIQLQDFTWDEIKRLNYASVFPLNKAETYYFDLNNKPKSERRANMAYLNTIEQDLAERYKFFAGIYVEHDRCLREPMTQRLAAHRIAILNKTESLYSKQKILYKTWNQFCEDTEDFMASSSDKIAPILDIIDPVANPASIPKGPNGNANVTESIGSFESVASPTTGSSRRRQHHGDSVRSEAEFLEILASLGRETARDPLVRAKLTSAIIPDMIMDPVERFKMRFIDTNNFVDDKSVPLNRLITDSVDDFTPEEHEAFCEAYAYHPKQFGKIAQMMGGKRPFGQCVIHYYRTKKKTDYKAIVAGRSRKQTKKGRKKARSGDKQTTTSLNSTPGLISDSQHEDLQGKVVDILDENNNALNDKELAALLADSVVRPRRAAAPLFGEEALLAAAAERTKRSAAESAESNELRKRQRLGKSKSSRRPSDKKRSEEAETRTSSPQTTPRSTPQPMPIPSVPNVSTPQRAIVTTIPSQTTPQSVGHSPNFVTNLVNKMKHNSNTNNVVPSLSPSSVSTGPLAGTFKVDSPIGNNLVSASSLSALAAASSAVPNLRSVSDRLQSAMVDEHNRPHMIHQPGGYSSTQSSPSNNNTNTNNSNVKHFEVLQKPQSDHGHLHSQLHPHAQLHSLAHPHVHTHTSAHTPTHAHSMATIGTPDLIHKEENNPTQQLPESLSSSLLSLKEENQDSDIPEYSSMTQMQQDDHKEKTSSYWSVNEISLFPKLLETYGTKWDDVSKHFKSKSTIMVKNFYAKNAEKRGWIDIANRADSLIKTGDSASPPPQQQQQQHQQQRQPPNLRFQNRIPGEKYASEQYYSNIPYAKSYPSAASPSSISSTATSSSYGNTPTGQSQPYPSIVDREIATEPAAVSVSGSIPVPATASASTTRPYYTDTNISTSTEPTVPRHQLSPLIGARPHLSTVPVLSSTPDAMAASVARYKHASHISTSAVVPTDVPANYMSRPTSQTTQPPSLPPISSLRELPHLKSYTSANASSPPALHSSLSGYKSVGPPLIRPPSRSAISSILNTDESSRLASNSRDYDTLYSHGHHHPHHEHSSHHQHNVHHAHSGFGMHHYPSHQYQQQYQQPQPQPQHHHHHHHHQHQLPTLPSLSASPWGSGYDQGLPPLNAPPSHAHRTSSINGLSTGVGSSSVQQQQQQHSASYSPPAPPQPALTSSLRDTYHSNHLPSFAEYGASSSSSSSSVATTAAAMGMGSSSSLLSSANRYPDTTNPGNNGDLYNRTRLPSLPRPGAPSIYDQGMSYQTGGASGSISGGMSGVRPPITTDYLYSSSERGRPPTSSERGQ